MTERTEIRVSKSKLVKLTIASLVFVGAGIWLLVKQPTTGNGIFDDPAVVKLVGVAAILFFGLALFVSVRKLGDRRPALVIDHTGITDYSSMLAAGLIPWRDIREIRCTKVLRDSLLLIIVTDPEAYIRRQPNTLKRKTMRLNYRQYGSPLSISTHALHCNPQELRLMLEEALLAYQAAHPSLNS
ncbi:MAG: STM3941 family protein [Chitinophagaceae bacterium]